MSPLPKPAARTNGCSVLDFHSQTYDCWTWSNPTLDDAEMWDIVHCYGLLYHLKKPDPGPDISGGSYVGACCFWRHVCRLARKSRSTT